MSGNNNHTTNMASSEDWQLDKPGAPSRPVPGRARRDKAVEVDFAEHSMRFWGRLHDTYGEADGSVTTVHLLEMTGLISVPDLIIERIELSPSTTAYDLCGLAAAQVPSVQGLSLVRGFSRGVREHLGGEQGCSHMTTMVLDLAGAAILYWIAQIRRELPYTHENRESGRWGAASLRVNSGFVGACLGWAADGEMVRRARRFLDNPPPAAEEHKSRQGDDRHGSKPTST